MKKIVRTDLQITARTQTREMVDNSIIIEVTPHPEGDTDSLSLWSVHRQIDEDEAKVERKFRIVATDSGFDDTARILGSIKHGKDRIHVLEYVD